MAPKAVSITNAEGSPLEALIDRPLNPVAGYVFAHGAGAGMEHRFMSTVAALLVERDIATLRFNFRYKSEGRSYPDRPAVLKTAIHLAIDFARDQFEGLPLFAGGKSMGGRVTADAVAEEVAGPVDGLVFFGYPLHAPGKDGTARASLLESVGCPMLFLQGTRDKLARIDLMKTVVGSLDAAVLHLIEEGDHSFKVPKRTGLTNDEVLVDLCDTMASWVRSI